MPDNNPQPEHPSRWASIRHWIGEQWKVLAVVGGLGYIVWALAEDDETREAFFKAVKLAENLFETANIYYQRIRRGLMVVIGIVVGTNLVMLYQGYHMIKIYKSGPLLYSIQHSKGIVEILIALGLSVLLVDFGLRVLPVLFGVDIFSGRLWESRPGEGWVEKVFRLSGKYLGWLWIAVVLLSTGEWHNNPAYLVASTGSIPVAIFLCNAWKAGQSERFRRTVVWLVALLIISCMILASMTPALEEFASVHGHGTLLWILIGFWTALGAFGFIMGYRGTKADKGRDAVAPAIALVEESRNKKVTLDEISKANTLLPGNHQSTGGSPGGMYSATGAQLGSQSRGMPQFAKALLAVGVLGVGLFLLNMFNGWSVHHTVMVPYQWLFSAVQTMDVITKGMLILGAAGLFLWILSMHTPGRR